jgi:itaconate CoA-transferase
MGGPAYFAAYGGSPPQRTGASHATIAPYGPFATGDSKRVFLGIQNEREWARFCEVVLEQSEVASDPRFDANSKRVANREALHATIEGVFGTLSADQVVERLEAAQIANARMNTMDEFLDHAQLAARDRWRDVDSPVGSLRALLPPVTMEDVDIVMQPVPALGEHTDAILQEIGFDAATIASLRQAGMI